MPISARTLFKNSGLSIDVIEQILQEEGYLSNDESLLELLKKEASLFRVPGIVSEAEIEFDWDFPDDWEEEDYENYKV